MIARPMAPGTGGQAAAGAHDRAAPFAIDARQAVPCTGQGRLQSADDLPPLRVGAASGGGRRGPRRRPRAWPAPVRRSAPRAGRLEITAHGDRRRGEVRWAWRSRTCTGLVVASYDNVTLMASASRRRWHRAACRPVNERVGRVRQQAGVVSGAGRPRSSGRVARSSHFPAGSGTSRRSSRSMSPLTWPTSAAISPSMRRKTFSTR